MSFELAIKDDARADITEAFEYYKNIISQLAEDFLERVDEALTRIQSRPEMYACVLAEIRQVSLRRFPYVVSYVFEDAGVVVLPLLHGRRHPKHWIDRT